MSCLNSNSPIDITDKNSGSCSLKCKYMFKYNDSSTTITNKGNYLLLSYDKPNTDPVVYNSLPYYVDEVRIYTPSLHSYNGVKANGEMIIVHINDYNQKLLVCIPIVLSSQSQVQLDNILINANKFANTIGKNTFITKSINLNNLIPSNKMYVYKGTLPFSPCNGENNIIVFNKDDGAFIPLNRNSLKLLNETIQNHSIETKENSYYINKNGPQNLLADSSSEIYIDCKPVTDDGEIIDNEITVNKSPFSDMFGKISYKKIVNSVYFQIIISLIAAYIIYKFFFLIMNRIKTETPTMPIKMPNLKSIRSKLPNISSIRKKE